MNAHRWLVSSAVRGYRSALRWCPSPLRERYGDDMRRTFEDRCESEASRGALAIVALFTRELLDLALTSVARRVGADPGFRPENRVDHQRRDPVGALAQDIRYAIRMLCRQPAFTAVAVLTLALGIGATTAVFTVVNGVLLRPLPYRDPDAIVQLLHSRNGRVSMSYSPPNYHDVTTESGVFSESAAISPATGSVTGSGDPQQIEGAYVTTGFFNVLGVTPRYGRGFVEADGVKGSDSVVILGDALWRRLFGARPDVVGSTMRMDGGTFTIVGVAPPEVTIPAGAEYWRPLVFTPDNLSDRQRGAQWVGAIARLKPGVTLDRAQNAMATVAERLSRDYPRTNQGRTMSATRLQDRIVRGIRPALLMLLGAVTLVLLVACVNVANLLLARANSRTREVAVRAAVGAGRGRLVQQFLAESVVLGLAGGVAGLVVAFWSTRALVALGPASIPRLAEVGIDWRVLAFTVATASVTSVVFGLVPALASTGDTVARFVSTAGRGSIGHGRTRIRKTLVVCEMALAVVLLVGAGLLMRSYQRISDVNPGFSPDHVLTFTISLPEAKYNTIAAVGQFVQQYVAQLGARAGVDSAAAVYGLPLDDGFSASSSFTRAGEPDSADTPSAGMRIITPGYFKALRIPVRAGRTFTERDDETAPEVVVINEEAARRFWPAKDPIGEQIHLGVRLADGVRSGQKTIVGVVGNVKFGGLDVSAPPEVYLPHAQHPVSDMTVVVRTAGDPIAFAPVARADLAALDRERPLAAVRTMDDVVGRSIAERRFTMLLLASFAAVAVLLAAIGVYGVLAYVVSQRTQEIGLRLAIGAAPDDVVRLFLREGVTLAIVGLAAGLAGALVAGRALDALLFGVTSTDPITYAGVAGALGFAALAASYLPARRAARVDPMMALRAD
jgi:putative ABC transport system permease protein